MADDEFDPSVYDVDGKQPLVTLYDQQVAEEIERWLPRDPEPPEPVDTRETMLRALFYARRRRRYRAQSRRHQASMGLGLGMAVVLTIEGP